MGICDSNNKINTTNIPKISIEPNDGNNFEYDKNFETIFPGSSKSISKEKLKIMRIKEKIVFVKL